MENKKINWNLMEEIFFIKSTPQEVEMIPEFDFVTKEINGKLLLGIAVRISKVDGISVNKKLLVFSKFLQEKIAPLILMAKILNYKKYTFKIYYTGKGVDKRYFIEDVKYE
jgi:hypothetical protein